MDGQLSNSGEDVPLPSFKRPPVTEVAMSAHFAPIPGLHIGHLGAYWQSVRDELPKLQQQPPLPRQEPEILRGPAQRPSIHIELTPMESVVPRFWLISEDENVLVQAQPDRLVLNWRKIRDDDEYPRFPFMRDRFLVEWRRFNAFLAAEGLAKPTAYHGEITYLNMIATSNVWATHADAHKVFAQWRATTLSPDVVQPEDVRMYERYTFPNRQNQLTGRLHARVEPVNVEPSGDPAFSLTLTARGAGSDDTEGLMDFMEAGRERIVRVFVAMTTDAMHDDWGLAHD